MRGVLAGLQDTLRVSRKLQSARGDIWGRCAASRESLMELQGDRLKGYGAVHPDLQRLLDEAIPLLLAGLDRLASLASDKDGQ